MKFAQKFATVCGTMLAAASISSAEPHAHEFEIEELLDVPFEEYPPHPDFEHFPVTDPVIHSIAPIHEIDLAEHSLDQHSSGQHRIGSHSRSEASLDSCLPHAEARCVGPQREAHILNELHLLALGSSNPQLDRGEARQFNGRPPRIDILVGNGGAGLSGKFTFHRISDIPESILFATANFPARLRDSYVQPVIEAVGEIGYFFVGRHLKE